MGQAVENTVSDRQRGIPTKPTRPGLTERIELEYRRHGTLCLIANVDVATGKAIVPTIGLTRTEEDFAAHVARTIDMAPRGPVDLRARPAVP